MDKTIRNGLTKLFFHDAVCSVEVGKNGLGSYERKKILYRNVKSAEIIDGNLFKKPIFKFNTLNGTYYMPFDKRYISDVISLKTLIENEYAKAQEESKNEKLKNIPVNIDQAVTPSMETNSTINQEEKPKIVLQATMPDFATKSVDKK